MVRADFHQATYALYSACSYTYVNHTQLEAAVHFGNALSFFSFPSRAMDPRGGPLDVPYLRHALRSNPRANATAIRLGHGSLVLAFVPLSISCLVGDGSHTCGSVASARARPHVPSVPLTVPRTPPPMVVSPIPLAPIPFDQSKRFLNNSTNRIAPCIALTNGSLGGGALGPRRSSSRGAQFAGWAWR